MNINQLGIAPQVSTPRYLTIAVLLVLGCFGNAGAQWTTPDASQNINNTNTGNVGIGTTSPTSKLAVTGRIQQSGSATDTGYLVTNSGNLANTTALNPGIAFFGGNGVNALYGADIGYSSTTSRYRTRLFSGNALADVAFGSQLNVQTNPTQSAFLEFLTVRGDTGNVGIGTVSPGEKLVTIGNMLTGNITSHTQLYSTYDSQANMIFELGYGTATSNITPLASFVLSKNLTSTNQGLGVISFANSNIANGNEKRVASISAWTDGALNSGALVFGTTATGTLFERMRIASTGKIGVGTTTPTALFHIMTASSDSDALRLHRNANTNLWGVSQFFSLNNSNNVATDYAQINGWIINNTAGAENGALAFYTRGAGTVSERMRITEAGVVAIGTPTPGTTHRLNVQGGTINSSDGLCINGDCRTSWSAVGGSQWTGTSTIYFNTGNVGIGTVAPSEKLEINGNLKVSGTGTGNITATGTIEGNNVKAKYQDVAEWVDSSQELPAGTVVVLDNNKSNHVIASTQAYDSRVAGVISLRPGVALGEEGEGRVLVAATGRVKVKVDASNGPIQIGDLLVTSDKIGVAMKSQPVEIGGVRLHRPGTLIGKALEPLAQGTGEILVLLSLQ